MLLETKVLFYHNEKSREGNWLLLLTVIKSLKYLFLVSTWIAFWKKMIQRSIKLFIQLSKLLNKVKYKPTQFQKTIQAKFHLKTYTVSSLKVNKRKDRCCGNSDYWHNQWEISQFTTQFLSGQVLFYSCNDFFTFTERKCEVKHQKKNYCIKKIHFYH